MNVAGLCDTERFRERSKILEVRLRLELEMLGNGHSRDYYVASSRCSRRGFDEACLVGIFVTLAFKENCLDLTKVFFLGNNALRKLDVKLHP